jgi:uncharacterized protein with NRDE domain
MCLIALAHRASEHYPLVIAANRDEDYERATRPAHVWEEAPDVVGGRDAVHGGSWLAVSRRGRFAAVTNLRGAVQRGRSRGLLVSSFVTSNESPEAFASTVAAEAAHYAGFHLIVGEAGGTAVYVAGGDEAAVPRVLAPGIYGFSNAPAGEHWPKEKAAIVELTTLLGGSSDLAGDLLDFLRAPRNAGTVEEEVFITGDRYGTRASTVVIATMDGISLTEQNYARGGIPIGAAARFGLPACTS